MKTPSILCYLFIVFCLSASITSKAQVDANDSLALVDLYNSTNGPGWTYNNNWLNGPVKEWLGIHLSNDNKRVTEINLSINNLSGHLPSSLGNLAQLEWLNLAVNQLTGYIPTELGKLKNLGILFLYDNHLSGNIPPELGAINGMTYISLNNNRLTGHIPPELGNLSNLLFLYLGNNQLSGTIPPQLGNLSRLSVLELDHNLLTGAIPPEFGNLLKLNNLRLSDNKLKGAIPTELGNLQFLQWLFLDHNQLSGTVPSFLTNLSIDSLNLSHNNFTFDGLELIAQTFPTARYNRQSIVRIHSGENALSVSAGGTLTNNIYQWYKLGEAGNTTITGDSVFHPTESGIYFVKVRNKIIKHLNLASNPVKFIPGGPLNAIAKRQEFLSDCFSVYPNPARNVLHVQTNGNASFSLLSADGKILLNANINKTGSINISGITAGLYYLKNNTTNTSKKIYITE